MGGLYYHLASDGDDTNLQLYALRKALSSWRALEVDYAVLGDATRKLKERCAFAVTNIGLSVSQLLGQNDPKPGNAKVRYPIEIFCDFVDVHGLDPQLKFDFKEFNDVYNGLRHFGQTTTGFGHQTANQLDYDTAKKAVEFGKKVWQVVIGVFRAADDGALDEFDLDSLASEDDC